MSTAQLYELINVNLKSKINTVNPDDKTQYSNAKKYSRLFIHMQQVHHLKLPEQIEVIILSCKKTLK